MNTKLHAVTDANGRPLSFFMTAGQISDYIGAAALLDELPKAQWLLADRRYDADWFRDALEEKGIKPCIPGRKSRNEPIKFDKRRYRRRNRIEIMFGRLKDWRRVATRYDRCPTTFFSAIALAATVIFWLCSTSPDPSTTLAPDLAFVDIQLAQGSSGLDVCRTIQSRWPDTFIVFVTANPKKIPDDFLGAHGVIPKPFTRNGLMSAMRYIEEGVCDPPPTSPQPASFIASPAFAASWS
jgi:transposase